MTPPTLAGSPLSWSTTVEVSSLEAWMLAALLLSEYARIIVYGTPLALTCVHNWHTLDTAALWLSEYARIMVYDLALTFLG